ncbi:MAG TPA: hypothetical protein VJQ54_14335 [Candidatus Sulfotelmatobacter sp.]|nr:hypothetical protein [Candidatus Sulfotelmatobacter sp.]
MNGNCQVSWPETLQRVTDALDLYAFDEANAEMIRSLPASERPKDSHSAHQWISDELARRGLMANRKFAARDRHSCGEGPLQVVACLETAAVGGTVDRIGTSVARTYRTAIMKMWEDTTV